MTLDGRELRSPAKARLVLPTERLAAAIAAEWEAQGEHIVPSTMPVTAIASTAADRIGARREEMVGEIARFAETDLVCYRAEAPESLVERQRQVWQPLLDWLAMRFDARLTATDGILPLPQPPEALAALRAAVAAYDDRRLAAVSVATAAAGSLVVALALIEGLIGPQEATAAAQLDERWQSETWGDDPEAVRRREAAAAELAAAHRFVGLL